MPQQPQPQWQPITMLPALTPHIDGMLESAEEQHVNLRQALTKPHVLDDYTVKRVIDVFTIQKNDLWLFDEQLERWQTGTLTQAQRKEVERLAGQMKKLREVITDILALADTLKEGTIEKVMAKPDEQLELELFIRMFGEGK